MADQSFRPLSEMTALELIQCLRSSMSEVACNKPDGPMESQAAMAAHQASFAPSMLGAQ